MTVSFHCNPPVIPYPVLCVSYSFCFSVLILFENISGTGITMLSKEIFSLEFINWFNMCDSLEVHWKFLNEHQTIWCSISKAHEPPTVKS